MPRDGSGPASELAVVGLVAAISVVLNRAVPRGWEIPANLSGAALMLGAAAASRSDLRSYGLDRAHAGRGLRTGLIVGAPLGLGVAAGAFLPQTRKFFRGELIVQADVAEAAYHALLRIPNATAVSEELIFRTAVEASFAARHSRVWAAVASAKLFGLWHILPTIDRLLSNPGIADPPRGHGPSPIAVVLASVASTSLGGLVLSLLRERTGSIVAPIVVHAALNVGAFAGGWVAHQLDTKQARAASQA